MKLSTHLKNRNLRWQRWWLAKESLRVRKKARDENDDQIYEEWYNKYRSSLSSTDYLIKRNITLDLLERAEKLGLPTPTLNDSTKWVLEEELGFFHGQQVRDVLTPDAMRDLRAAIRKEEGERRAVVMSWAKIVGVIAATLVGLSGAVVGLLVALRRK
jgi:hypothetical protein